MAEPLFIVRNASNEIVLDSRNAAGGACVDLIEIPPNTAVTYTYPDFAGRTLALLNVGPSVYPGMDTLLGYPRLTFTSINATRSFTVMVL